MQKSRDTAKIVLEEKLVLLSPFMKRQRTLRGNELVMATPHVMVWLVVVQVNSFVQLWVIPLKSVLHINGKLYLTENEKQTIYTRLNLWFLWKIKKVDTIQT